jgi:hypothetical protein
MYEGDSRTLNNSALSCFFDAAKVLRKIRQNNPFPTTPPKNPRIWEKSGISWEKVRRRRKREAKVKKTENHSPFPNKKNSFFPSLGKIVGILGKIIPTTNILTLQIFIIRNKCLFLHYNSVKRFNRKWI